MNTTATLAHAAARLRKGLEYGADMHSSAQLCAADALRLIERALKATRSPCLDCPKAIAHGVGESYCITSETWTSHKATALGGCPWGEV